MGFGEDVKCGPTAVLCQAGLLSHQTVVLSIHDLTQLSVAQRHPGEDFIFMFANLPLHLPVVTINTLLCVPEKCLKKHFVRVLYGLAWQYSWLMTTAKLWRCPGEFSIWFIWDFYIWIIPPQLHLYVMFKAIPQVFCYHGLLMRGSATRSYGHLKNTFIDSLTMTWNNYTSFATQGTYMYSVQQWPTCRCSWATAGVRTCTVCSALVFVCVPALFTSMFIARRLFYCLTGGLLLLLLFIANKCRSVEKPLRARDAVPSCL